MQLEYRHNVLPESVWLLAHEIPMEAPPPFRVREAGFFSVQKQYSMARKAPGCYMLLHTLAGNGELIYGGKKYTLPAGSVALVRVDEMQEHRIAFTCPNWQFQWLLLHGAGCEYYYNSIFSVGFTVLFPGNEHTTRRVFSEVFSLIQNPHNPALSQISHQVSGLLVELAQHQAEHQRREALHLTAIEDTVAYIQEHYEQQIDVDFLAEKASLSKYYYIKLFKEFMHATPYEYLLSVRINQAKKLLLATDYKSAQIGGMVGFADECNFSRTFKRLVGTTPIQFRKNA